MVEIIQSWGAVVGALGTFIAAAGAWRGYGRVEVLLTEIRADAEEAKERGDRHSGKIHDHDIQLVRIDALPALIARHAKTNAEEHAKLEGKIDDLAQTWMNDCRACLGAPSSGDD